MKNNFTFILLVVLSVFSLKTSAQTSTEQFETESNGSSSFTDNGVIFTIISNVNTYDIQAGYPGTGWNGTAADNRYIDNSGTGNQSAGTSFSIKTTSNLFKVNRFWVYAAAANTTLGVAGTLTITGKLSGVTKFTQTKTTGFTATTATANGYTLIDLTNLNGQNYSNIVIDQLQITAGGNFQYLSFDAFTWVKDPGLVLGVNDFEKNNKFVIYPNPTTNIVNVNSDIDGNIQITNQLGQTVKTFKVKANVPNSINVENLTDGVYFVKDSNKTKSYKLIIKK
jgi:hypothetical protein